VARIVLSTFGSLGDLHPFLAIAGELRKRGHQAIIAASAVYRNKVEAENIGFAPVRPDVAELMEQPALLRKLWDPTRGSEYLLRDYLAPRVEESYEDLTRACAGADLLVTHVVVYAAPIVAEVNKLPWVSVALQPSIFLSASDPPVLPPTWLRYFYPLGRHAVAGLLALGKARVRQWVRPVIDLRRRLGLSIHKNPAFEDVSQASVPWHYSPGTLHGLNPTGRLAFRSPDLFFTIGLVQESLNTHPARRGKAPRNWGSFWQPGPLRFCSLSGLRP
jgi:rhamnosyltransferase subunit B